MRRMLSALVLMLGTIAPALAVEPDEMLADPALEARARHLSAGLRCLVCQNQSIDESDAPLARDLRLLLRERIKAGDSDAAVDAFLVARYGDFILLRPRLKPETILLWATPLAVLVVGGGLAALARRRQRSEPPPLSDAEEAEFRRLKEAESGSAESL